MRHVMVTRWQASSVVNACTTNYKCHKVQRCGHVRLAASAFGIPKSYVRGVNTFEKTTQIY